MYVSTQELLFATCVLVSLLAVALELAATGLVPRVVAAVRTRILHARVAEKRQRYVDAVLTPAVAQVLAFVLLQLSLALLDAGFRGYIAVAGMSATGVGAAEAEGGVTGHDRPVPAAMLHVVRTLVHRLPSYLLVAAHYWTIAMWFYGSRVGLFMYQWGAVGQLLALVGFMVATATTYAYAGDAAGFDPLVVAAAALLRRPLESLRIGLEIVCAPLLLELALGTPRLVSPSSSPSARSAWVNVGNVAHRAVLLACNVVLVLLAAQHGHELSVLVADDLRVFRPDPPLTPCSVDADTTCALPAPGAGPSTTIFLLLHVLSFGVYLALIWSTYAHALEIINTKATLMSHEWALNIDLRAVEWRGPMGWHDLHASIQVAMHTVAASLWWPLRNLRAADISVADGMLSDALLRILQAFSSVASVVHTAHTVLASRSVAWSARVRVPVNAADDAVLDLRGLSLRVTSYGRRHACGCPVPRFWWRRRPLLSVNFANSASVAVETGGDLRPADYGHVGVTLTARLYTAALCRQLRRLEMLLHTPMSLQPAAAWRGFLMRRHQRVAAAFTMWQHDARGALRIDANGFVARPLAAEHGGGSVLPVAGGSIVDVPDDSSVAAEDETRDVWETDPTDVLYSEYAAAGGTEHQATLAAHAALAAAGPHVNLAVGGGWLLPRMSAMLGAVLADEPVMLPGETQVRWWNLTVFDMGRAFMWAARDDAAQAARSFTEATALLVEGVLGPLGVPLTTAPLDHGFFAQVVMGTRRALARIVAVVCPHWVDVAPDVAAPATVLQHVHTWLQRAPGPSNDDDSMIECELVLRHRSAVLRVPLVGCSAAGWHGLLLEQSVLRELLCSMVHVVDTMREHMAYSSLHGIATQYAADLPPTHQPLAHAAIRHIFRTSRKCGGSMQLATHAPELDDLECAQRDAFQLYTVAPSSDVSPEHAANEFVRWLVAAPATTSAASGAVLQVFDVWERAVQELVVVFAVENALASAAGDQGPADARGAASEQAPIRVEHMDAPALPTTSTYQRMQQLLHAMLQASRQATHAVSSWHARHALWRWLMFDLLQRMALSYATETSRRRQQEAAGGLVRDTAGIDAPLEMPMVDLAAQHAELPADIARTAPVVALKSDAAAPPPLPLPPVELTGTELVVHLINLLVSTAATPIAAWA